MADDLATLQARRAAVQAALDALAGGQQVKEVWKNGQRLTFAGMTAGEATTYLRSIDAEIADQAAIDTPGTLSRRRYIPLRF